MIRIAVKYKVDASAEAIEALEKKHGLSAARTIPALRIRSYDVDPASIPALESEDLVEYVEEDHVMRLM